MLRFAYRLAVRLGRVDVRRMLSEITYSEFQEWVAFAELEPFDETRDDYRTAAVCQTLANTWRGKDQPFVKLQDVLIRFGDDEPPKKEEKKQTWQQQKMIGMQFAKMMSAAATRPAPPKRKKA